MPDGLQSAADGPPVGHPCFILYDQYLVLPKHRVIFVCVPFIFVTLHYVMVVPGLKVTAHSVDGGIRAELVRYRN